MHNLSPENPRELFVVIAACMSPNPADSPSIEDIMALPYFRDA
jgi:hypothetical protein